MASIGPLNEYNLSAETWVVRQGKDDTDDPDGRFVVADDQITKSNWRS